MNANFMNYRELLAASALWGRAPGPVPSDTRAFLEASPYSAPFLPIIDAARDVLSRAPLDGSEFARLTDALDAADDGHDRVARYAIAQLEVVARHESPELATRAKTLLNLLFPDRGSVVNDTYEGEAGRVESRARAMTDATRADLRRYPIAGGGTVESQLDALNAAAAEIGTLLHQRAALGVGGVLPTNAELLDAKRTLVKTIDQTLRTFTALDQLPAGRGLDENGRLKFGHLREVWTTAARQATERSRARAAAAAAGGGGSPGTPPTPA